MSIPIAHNPAPLLVPDDTTLDAARVQWSVWRKMSPSQRLQTGFDLSAAARARLERGVKMRHPQYDQTTVNQAVFLLMNGQQLFAQVFPGCTVQP